MEGSWGLFGFRVPGWWGGEVQGLQKGVENEDFRALGV